MVSYAYLNMVTLYWPTGFDIHDDVAIHGAKLEIPSFTRGKKQLSLEYSQRLSKVRIHIERVIGLLNHRLISTNLLKLRVMLT